jgi:2-polyprenyl-3-methyl-5-hydroxy-6-metoxy-1,4-benzoquinol methylase
MKNEYTNKSRQYFTSSRQDVAAYMPLEAKTILDVGMGEGNFLHSLKENRPEIETWGIELEEHSYNQAKNKVDKSFEGTVEDNLANLPDNYFDCITFNDVLEHLISPESILKKIKTKLSPSGQLIASIPNIMVFGPMIKILKNLLIKKDWVYEDSGIMDRTHLHFYTKKSMQRMFIENGYQIVDTQGTNYSNPLKLKLLNLLTFNHFSESNYLQYIIVAKV